MITKIKSVITGKTARNLYITFFGNGINQVTGFVAVILVSRNLGPTNFGLFSLAFGFFMTASKFTDLGVNLAMSRFVALHNKDTWPPYAKLALLVKLILTVATTLGGFLLAPYLSITVFHNSDLIPLIRLASLSLVGIMALDFYTSLTQALGKFGQSTVVQGGAALFKIVAIVTVIILGATSTNSFFLVYLLSPVIGAIVGYFINPRNYLSSKYEGAQKKELTSFSLWLGIAALLGSLGSYLDVFMVGNRLSIYDVGVYSAASRISQLVSLVQTPLGMVLSIRSASFIEERHLRQFYKKTILLAVALVALVVIVWPLSQFIIVATVGEAFVGSITVFRILMIAAVVSAATTIVNSNFYGRNRPEYFAFSSVIYLVIFYFANAYFIPILGAAGAAYGNLVASFVGLVFSVSYLQFARRFIKS